MQANVGGLDRALRVVAGVALLSLLALLEGPARGWGLVGIAPLATGLLRWCPAYTLFGWTTCPLSLRR